MKDVLTLQIRGLSHVPSFKNTKMIITRPKPRLITDPRKKQWMERAIRLIESQFAGAFPMRADETVGAWRKRLQIASCLPLDDSLGWMIPGPQSVVRVAPGEEGADIVIEPMARLKAE